MVVTRKISLQTKGQRDIIDITAQVAQRLAETSINSIGRFRQPTSVKTDYTADYG